MSLSWPHCLFCFLQAFLTYFLVVPCISLFLSCDFCFSPRKDLGLVLFFCTSCLLEVHTGKGPGTCSRRAALFPMIGLTLYVCLPFTFPQPMDVAAAAVFFIQTPSSPLQQRLVVCWTYSLCSMVSPSTSLLRTRLDVRKPLPPAGAPNLSRYEMEFEQPQCVPHLQKQSPFSAVAAFYFHIDSTTATVWGRNPFWGRIWGFSILLVSAQMVVYMFVSHSPCCFGLFLGRRWDNVTLHCHIQIQGPILNSLILLLTTEHSQNSHVL